MELSWLITSITEVDYDGISETVKQVIPLLDGEELAHQFIRASAETDDVSKTAIKTMLINKGYSWTTEI